MYKYLVMVLSLISAPAVFAQALPKLCYSATSRTIQSGVFNDGVRPNNLSRGQRHGLALRASALVYTLADLDGATSGKELLAKHQTFREQMLGGYTFDHYFSNRATGLKYMILSPENPTDPWIFAFAGTQTAIDWMSDITLGRAQLAQLEGLLYALTNCEYDDGHGQAMGARNWIFTGHSLGGGLAQAFAYLAQKRRMRIGLSPAPLEVVTFNAFGALDLVEDSLAAAKPVSRTIFSANYFVTGDVVSRIGVPLGNTFELQMPPASPFQVGERHALETVMKLAMPRGIPRFEEAQEAQPPTAGLLNALKDHLSFFKFLPDNRAANLTVRMQQVNILYEAVEILSAHRVPKPYDDEATAYLSNLALVFLDDLQKEPTVAVRDVQIEQLQDILNRLTALHNR